MQNAIDNSGKTASSVACQRGHADVVKIFMQKASDLSIDLNTMMALQVSIMHGRVLGLQKLLFPLYFAEMSHYILV